MAKAKEKVKEVGEDKPSLPHIAFTESEVTEVADFLNAVWIQAEFKGSMQSMRDLDKLFSKMHAHHKKLQEYVLEVKRITHRPKEE